ncbi:hypothetical protein KL948_003093 [Ogataea haglerorum]|nr:hypothetical protein KL948_003093 [Ogataea haglerorum]KAG7756161.1 hypothetical protein KL947_003767 [Ogataea haglerorum]
MCALFFAIPSLISILRGLIRQPPVCLAPCSRRCAKRWCSFKRSSPPRQWSARPSGRRRRLRSPISPPLGLDESYPVLWRCKGVSLEASQNQR